MKPLRLVYPFGIILPLLVIVGCHKPHEADVEVIRTLDSQEAKDGVAQLRRRIEKEKPPVAIPDGVSAGRIGLSYYCAIWGNPAREPRVTALDCGDAWLVIVGVVPEGAIGGNGHVLLSKQTGMLIGALHELLKTARPDT